MVSCCVTPERAEVYRFGGGGAAGGGDHQQAGLALDLVDGFRAGAGCGV